MALYSMILILSLVLVCSPYVDAFVGSRQRVQLHYGVTAQPVVHQRLLPGSIENNHLEYINCIAPLQMSKIMERERALLRAQQQTDKTNGAWMPFAVLSCVDDKLPMEVTIAGESYVIWRDPYLKDDFKTKGWSIMKDVCPHRMAPLSQGRVDPDTGCIECPYHGWQFEAETGKCTTIPQLSSAEAKRMDGSKAKVQSFPVHITNDLLWGFIPLPDGQASCYPKLPEQIFPKLLDNNISFVSRELPYSFDYLVENFMDPAHIPFAHHSLQGVREDGSPIPMEILTEFEDSSLVEVRFQDKVNGKERDGIVSFAPPCYYHFRLRNATEVDYKLALVGLVVPTTPGKCRLIFGVESRSKFLQKAPKWFSHAFSNRFVDTDLWIHEQERNARMGGMLNPFTTNEGNSNNLNSQVGSASIEAESDVDSKFGTGGRSGRMPAAQPMKYKPPRYYLPTESDKGVIAWRRWWARHMSLSPIFGPCLKPPIISREEQTDLYNTHTKNCIHCSKALDNAKKLKIAAPLVSLATIALSRTWPMRVVGVGMYGLMYFAGRTIERAMTGADRTERISAAQFARKNKKK